MNKILVAAMMTAVVATAGAEPTGAVDFEVETPRHAAGVVVNAADFGVSESAADNVLALNRALAFCRTNAAARLVVPKGTYRLTAETAVTLEGLKDFTFDGGGATFVFFRTRGPNFRLIRNERLSFRNLTVDWDWERDPLASIVEVVEATDDHVDFKFVHYDTFPRRDVRAAYISAWDEAAQAVGVSGLSALGRGFDISWDGPRKDPPKRWLSGNVLRIARGAANLPVGSRWRMQHYYYDLGGFHLASNRHLLMEDVEVRSSVGFAFYVFGQQRYTHLRRVNVRAPKDDPRRVITCTADHIHVGRSQGWLKLEDCDFSLGADDGINVHDCTAWASEVAGTNALLVANGSGAVSVGDEAEVRNADYSPTGFRAKVTAKSPVAGDPRKVVVAFDAPVPVQTHPDGFVILNRSYCSDNVILRGCKFRDNRARGVIIQANDVTVENCTFSHTESSAMKLTTGWTRTLWCEGVGVTNCLVRNCLFRNCNSGGFASGTVAITTYLRETSDSRNRGITDYPILSDILFEGNRFVDCNGLPDAPTSSARVVYRDNMVCWTRHRPLAAFATVRTTLTNGTVRTRPVLGETLADGTVRVTVPKDSIGPDVATVDVLHPAFAAKKGETGYWIGPRGQLGRFTRDKGLWTTDVYNNHLILPYFGFKTSRGLATCWIKGLRFEAEVRVDVKGGRYEMVPRFRIAKIGFRPYEDAVVEFRNLGSEADYSEAARFFRDTRLKAGEIVPLVEKMKTREETAYLKDAFTARLPMFCAKPRQPGDQTPETEPPVTVMYTPAQAERLMEELKAAGVEKMEFCASGWTTGGYDGRFPSFFPCADEIGGDEAIRKLAATAKRLGYRLGLQSAYTAAFRISPRWSEDIVCKNPDGSLLRGETYWCGGDTYRACVGRVSELFLDEDMKSWKSLGLTGANYLDVFTAISPCPCCDPKHAYTRAESAEVQRKIAQRCIDELGGFASECGEDHLVNELSYINYVSADMKRWQGYGYCEKLANQETIFPLRCPNPEKNLIDEIVPFWEIVYHGFVYHPTDRLSQNHTSGSRKASPSTWLLSVEFGGRPIPYIGPKTPVAEIVRAYADYKPLAHLSTVFMQAHRRLTDDVRLVTYADGTEIVINYGKTPYAYRNAEVAPKSYRLYTDVASKFAAPGY